MIKTIFVVSAILGVVLGAPAEPEQIAIVAQNSDIQPDGSFQWSYETADGAKQEQTGSVKQVDKEESVSSIQGSASWVDSEGNKHEMTYIADENGFQPQGSDVPQIPPQIARALEWIAAHPEPEEKH